MIQSKRALVIALFFPIFTLICLSVYKAYLLSYGTEVILPISGYDPRDLLSGHYLIYRIEYGVDSICSGQQTKNVAYVCLEPKQFSHTAPESCRLLIQGICHFGRFEAGIERFYVPEERARELESQIRTKPASIVLSVFKSGQVQIKDLLIDGVSWKTKTE